MRAHKSGREGTGIASWPEEERPRERLLSRGPHALTDAELVAILIRVGFKGTSAVELGRQILKRFGSLRAMVQAPVLALLDVKGLKGAKAAQLLAATEVARRVAVPAQRKDLQFRGTSAVAAYLTDRLRGLPAEQFRVLYLNRRNTPLDDALIAQGAVDSVRPSLRDIIARASPGKRHWLHRRAQSSFRRSGAERIGLSANQRPHYGRAPNRAPPAGSRDYPRGRDLQLCGQRGA